MNAFETGENDEKQSAERRKKKDVISQETNTRLKRRTEIEIGEVNCIVLLFPIVSSSSGSHFYIVLEFFFFQYFYNHLTEYLFVPTPPTNLSLFVV